MHSATLLFRRVWGEMPVYLYSALCGVACLAAYAHFGRSFSPNEALASFEIFALFAVVLFFVDILGGLALKRPERPITWARERYFSSRTVDAALGGAPAMALCIVMIPLFSSLKAMIPLFAPYSWDAAFIRLDRILFLGRDAWEATQPLLGYPLVSALLALVYSAWGFLLYFGCMFISFFKVVPEDLKRRFFLSYAMAWSLVGGVMAIIFASVGPVFAEVLIGNDHFAAQLAYLHAAHAQVPVLTVPVQEMLLQRFAVDDSSLGSGISAMPSMHVGIATLFWLAMREVGPRLGRIFGVFTFLIWVGSFHLAYHYAADGIVSFAAICAIWWASRRIFAWWDRTFPAPFQALRTNTAPAE